MTGVTVSPATLSLNPGQTGTLTATVSPSNATNKGVTWSSSNTSIATVDTNGKVTAKGAGNTTITVTTKDGGKKATCAVTVAEKPVDKVEAFVTRLYKVVLGRDPDADGLNYWMTALKSGKKKGADVVQGFYLSDEMVNKRKPKNEDYVVLAYRGIMGREPDADGKPYWVDALNSGASYMFVVSGFVGSQEFADLCNSYDINKGTLKVEENRDKNINITKFCGRMYTKALNRSYDVDGLNFWCGRIIADGSKKNVISVAKSFFDSDEYRKKNRSNEEYLTDLYHTFFDREPDRDGKACWLNEMRNGKSRDEVLNGFADSKEFEAVRAKFGL